MEEKVEKGQKRSIAKNTIFNFFCQLVTVVAPLLTASYIARVFDAELIGQTTYVGSILSYFSLAIIFGTNFYGAMLVSKVRDDPKERSRVFYELFLIKTIMFGLCSVVYLFFILFYVEYQTLFLIYIIFLFTSYSDVTWFFQGVEKFGLVSLRTISMKIIAVVLVFVFIHDRSQFYLYVVISLSSALLPNLLILPSLRKDLVRVTKNELNIKRHWRKLVPFFLVDGLISIYAVMDKTMLRLVTDSNAEVGYYEHAHKIYNICSTLTVIIAPVLSSRISYVYQDKQDRERIFETGFRFAYYFSFPIMVGILFLAGPMINVLFGGGYEPSINILMVFSVLPLITSIGMMTGQLYYNPTMRTKWSILACGIGAVVNFGLNILLAYFYGALGAAIATVIAEFVITAVEMALFKDGNRRHLLAVSWKYILASALMGGVLFVMTHYFNTGNEIVTLVLDILLPGIFYCSILILFREELSMRALRKIRNKFIKKKEPAVIQGKDENSENENQ